MRIVNDEDVTLAIDCLQIGGVWQVESQRIVESQSDIEKAVLRDLFASSICRFAKLSAIWVGIAFNVRKFLLNIVSILLKVFFWKLDVRGEGVNFSICLITVVKGDPA